MKRELFKNVDMRKKIILSIISVVLFFTIGEVVIRLFNLKFELSHYFKFEEHFQIDPQLSNRYLLKDPYVFWRLAPNKKSGINSLGFRDSEQVSIVKDENTFRILCIGDSITFGYPITLNRPEDAYPKILERPLNISSGTRKFEVINAGVPGYTSYQGLQYLRHHLLRYKPDLVIAQFGINDAEKACYFEDKDQKIQSDWLIEMQNILIKSRLYRLFSKVIFCIKCRTVNFNYKKYSNSGDIRRVSPEDYAYNLEKMVKTGKKNNFKVLFIPPARREDGEIILDEEYIPPQYAMINTYKVFKERESEAELFFNDNVHLTPEGHKIIAEQIYKYLIRQDLINK